MSLVCHFRKSNSWKQNVQTGHLLRLVFFLLKDMPSLCLKVPAFLLFSTVCSPCSHNSVQNICRLWKQRALFWCLPVQIICPFWSAYNFPHVKKSCASQLFFWINGGGKKKKRLPVAAIRCISSSRKYNRAVQRVYSDALCLPALRLCRHKATCQML